MRNVYNMGCGWKINIGLRNAALQDVQADRMAILFYEGVDDGDNTGCVPEGFFMGIVNKDFYFLDHEKILTQQRISVVNFARLFARWYRMWVLLTGADILGEADGVCSK